MTILDKIVQWNKERNNVEFLGENEIKMLQEELDEFILGYNRRNNHEMIDALCDIIVVATGAIHKLGYNPNIAMNETLKEISSRQQDPMQLFDWNAFGVNGKWKKWQEQPKETLYKADYTKAKYEIHN